MNHVPTALSRRRRVALGVSGFVLDYLLALPVGCAGGLLWANILPDSYFRFAHATTFLVNDIGIGQQQHRRAAGGNTLRDRPEFTGPPRWLWLAPRA